MAQSKLWTAAPEWAVYPLGLLPAVDLFVRAFSNSLGADPLRVLENGLGEWALRFLILGLAVTPLLRFGRINLVKYRRAFGLVAFIYVVLHLSVYLALDKQFFWGEIGKDIIKRPYITIGMAAFLMLVPLAVTSNRFSIRKLGSLGWRKLHRLVYPAVLAGAVHYLLLVKAWPPEPIIYLAIVVALLAVRRIRPARRARQAA
ncbi:protein-methionine-sulfoxide reductase heme-binding subunit MsrQ [Oricola indica]|uniref:protein-methionine-sulfoxide reductase heme-binding subunit MsrQ n=1 Tax=Oricola indica TaxID=2872591 RepID=UPI003CCC04D9